MKKYVKASFNTGTIPDWLRKDKSALDALNRAGIDLANCNFSKERKGKVGDNYIAYLVKGTKDFDSYSPFVWIPGLYNDDKYVSFKDWDKRGWDGTSGRYTYGAPNSRAVKYFSKKDLNFIDTIFINIDDNTKAHRTHYQDPRYDSKGEYAGQYFIPDKKNQWNTETKQWDKFEPAHWSEAGQTTWEGGRYGRNQRRDKSGYVIPDPKDRLQKFYNTKEGMSRRVELIRNTLDSVYTQLEDVKEVVFNSILPRGTRDDYRQYRIWYEYLDNALGFYENALKILEKLDRDGISESSWSSPHDISEALSYLKKAQSYINDLKKMLDMQ